MRCLRDVLRTRRRGTAVLAGLVAVAAPELARAQSRLELEWDAPPECPRAPAVSQKLDALLGDAAGKKSRLRAEGRIVRFDGRYRLTLTVHDQDRKRDRTIESDSCGDLAGAAAVTLGLLLRAEAEALPAGSSPGGAAETPNGAAGNDADARSTAPAAAPSAAQSPSSNEHDSSSRSETRTPSSPPRWNVLLQGPTAYLDVGRLPKIGFGLGGGVGFRYGDWRAGFSGRIFFGQTLWSNLASPDGGAEVRRAVLEAWACRGFHAGDFELSPCLTAGLDHLGAKGVGTDVTPASATSNSALLGGALVAHYHLAEWLALIGSAGLGVETARPQLTITSLGEVQTLGPIVFSVGLGPEWIF